MKIIINENQLRVIVENEEYINSIKEMINTFDIDNIEIAFQIMKGMRIKQSVILEDYMELFDIFELKPSKRNLIKIVKFDDDLVVSTKRTPDLLFKLPNLNMITFIRVGSLDNLVEYDGVIKIVDSNINSVPNLVKVGTLNVYHKRQMLLPKLREAKGLGLMFSGIRDLPSLESVGTLNIHDTPLGKKLLETMSEDEIKNKYGVKNMLLV